MKLCDGVEYEGVEKMIVPNFSLVAIAGNVDMAKIALPTGHEGKVEWRSNRYIADCLNFEMGNGLLKRIVLGSGEQYLIELTAIVECPAAKGL